MLRVFSAEGQFLIAAARVDRADQVDRAAISLALRVDLLLEASRTREHRDNSLVVLVLSIRRVRDSRVQLGLAVQVHVLDSAHVLALADLVQVVDLALRAEHLRLQVKRHALLVLRDHPGVVDVSSIQRPKKAR